MTGAWLWAYMQHSLPEGTPLAMYRHDPGFYGIWLSTFRTKELDRIEVALWEHRRRQLSGILEERMRDDEG